MNIIPFDCTDQVLIFYEYIEVKNQASLMWETQEDYYLVLFMFASQLYFMF